MVAAARPSTSLRVRHSAFSALSYCHPGLEPGSTPESLVRLQNGSRLKGRDDDRVGGTFSASPLPSWSHLVRPSTSLLATIQSSRHKLIGCNQRTDTRGWSCQMRP